MMVRYEEMKQEMLLSQIEYEDEIYFYEKKIEEFRMKKEQSEKKIEAYRYKLDDYVMSEYKKDVEKSWYHFMKSDKNNNATTFFSKMLKNTGFQISRYEKKKVKFILNPSEVLNIKKSSKVLNAIFEIARKYNLEEVKIQVVNIKKNNNGEMFISKMLNNYQFKSENSKRSTIKDENGILFIDKIIKYASSKE